ncbi:MAG: hypothetical protein Q8P92_01860 [Candidatus Daviesbacteria bacterium]|nr:hypothetical protein [Candidatus Daviesbacteria bacterium]
MPEKPAESRWLYNQPTPGIVENWYRRNEAKIRSQWIDPKILDGAFIMASTAEEMNGTLNFRYSQDRVVMTRTGLEVPRRDSQLYDVWQAHKRDMETRGERDGAKYSVRRSSPFLTDSELQIEVSDFSWSGMELNNDVNIGVLPESLRDGILPTLRSEGYVFEGEPPNNAVVQGIITTKDKKLVLTTRAVNAQYYQGTVSPSFEEQIDRDKDDDPIETYLRAVSYSPKLKRGEELRLNVRPENIRLVSMVLEPQFNAVGFVVLGVCEEESEEIDETKFGVDRSEFNPEKPIWTLPLDEPSQLLRDFYNPQGFRWHGIGRERVVDALASVLGYEEALDRFYKARP